MTATNGVRITLGASRRLTRINALSSPTRSATAAPKMITNMLRDVLNTALPGAATLAGLPRRRRLVELEFNLPAKRLSASRLATLMQQQGSSEEEAAVSLGAGGWRTFFLVTLPNVKWGLLYGVVLCASRAMGEFGAVSVVSGHIRGHTNTLPLHVEVLYNEYNMAAAFACASILSVLGLVTLLLKTLIEWRAGLRRRTH